MKMYLIGKREILYELFPDYDWEHARFSLDRALAIAEAEISDKQQKELIKSGIRVFTHAEAVSYLDAPESAGIWHSKENQKSMVRSFDPSTLRQAQGSGLRAQDSPRWFDRLTTKSKMKKERKIKNSERSRIYEIGGKAYELKPLTLEQDELLAPIVREMLETFGKTFESVAEAIHESPLQIGPSTALRTGPSTELGTSPSTSLRTSPEKSGVTLSFALDVMKINAWLHEKRYVRRLLAVLLTEEGQEFDESQVAEREKVMAKVGRDVAPEVINYFFGQSGIFGRNITASSPATNTIPTTR